MAYLPVGTKKSEESNGAASWSSGEIFAAFLVAALAQWVNVLLVVCFEPRAKAGHVAAITGGSVLNPVEIVEVICLREAVDQEIPMLKPKQELCDRIWAAFRQSLNDRRC